MRYIYIFIHSFLVRAQELCESRGGRPGLPVHNSPYGLSGRKEARQEQEEKEEAS